MGSLQVEAPPKPKAGSVVEAEDEAAAENAVARTKEGVEELAAPVQNPNPVPTMAESIAMSFNS